LAFLFLFSYLLAKDTSLQQSVNVFLSETHEAPYQYGRGSADVLSNVNAAILGQLFKLSEHYELEPALAESWFWEQSTGTYHIRLKKGLRFHNGRAVTARDLEFSLLRGFFSRNPSFFQTYVGSIEGAEEVVPGTPYRSGLVSGVKVLSELEISVKLRRANPAFLFSLIHPFLSLTPIEAFKEDLLTWKTNPIGAGPFRVTQDFDGSKMIVSRVNPKEGHINEVIFWSTYDPKISYDFVFRRPAQLEKDDYEAYISKNTIAMRGISFSFANPLGANLDFRRFIMAAINRAELTSILAPDAAPSFELLPKVMWGRAGLEDPYNPAEAKALFAGLNIGKTKKPLIGYVFGQNVISSANQRLIGVIESGLAAFDIKIEWRTTKEKFLSPEIAKEASFELSGMLAEHVDPLLMYGVYRSTSPLKFRRPMGGDKEFDALYEAAGLATDKPERIKTMQALSKYVQDQAYFIPLAEEKNMILHRKGLVKSFGRQTQGLILFLDQIELN
jgi:ABC-type transport system substrate-binding protein